MVLPQVAESRDLSELTASQKRRHRRRKLQKSQIAKELSLLCTLNDSQINVITSLKPALSPKRLDTTQVSALKTPIQSPYNVTRYKPLNNHLQVLLDTPKMSSKESMSREEILAAREAKKLAKQKVKTGVTPKPTQQEQNQAIVKVDVQKDLITKPKEAKGILRESSDEVDRAHGETAVINKSKVLAERQAKKAAKQGVKKDIVANPEMTVKDVVETLKDIKNVAKEVQDLTAKVSAIHFDAKPEEAGKSKADLKAERRAKQEAQRTAKQAATEQKAKPKQEGNPKVVQQAKEGSVTKEKSPKPKSDKPKVQAVSTNKVNWFQHLYVDQDKETLNKIAINSNLHPAIMKLGVQLASRVVTGSNARCIALLDALKKMLRDYTLPAKTEFARGMEAHLASSLDFLWAMRQPSASQTNAVKYFRHHLTQLPNNVVIGDAKKKLAEEIDKYIEDQIDTAGEAISIAVRNKISPKDNILTYGCSSIIERILREAWEAKREFHTVIVGNRVHSGAKEMLRRLTASGLPCTYVDITAVSFVMKSINKVLLGAGSLLVNGSVLSAAGTAQVALVARACNVPVLVACETHKFSERVQTDAFVYNEIGDPDALIDKSDKTSPLKDWRSIPNLTPLNLLYDVTPPSLVTAVITEKAILPCTSAPVVLRTKLTEYGM